MGPPLPAPLLLSVWGLAVSSLVLETATSGELSVSGASRLALVSLPWLAVAGLPASSRRGSLPGGDGGEGEGEAGGGAARSRTPALLGLALPVLGLAGGLEVAAGHATPAAVGIRVGILLVVLAAWSHAAARAAAGSRSTLYGALWFFLVPGVAACTLVWTWALRDGTSEPESAAFPPVGNPLVWVYGWSRAEGAAGGHPPSAADLGVVALPLAIVAVLSMLGRGRRELGAWVGLAAAPLLLPEPAGARPVPSPAENRFWLADLELEGPLEEVRLDAGEDGETRLVAGLLSGERLRVAVPIPVRSPTGAASLASVAPPSLSMDGTGAARWLGWSPSQPFTELPAGFLSRRIPLPMDAGPRRGPSAGWGELALLLAASCLAFAWRRHPARSLAVGAVGALLLGGLAGRPPPAPPARRLLEAVVGDDAGPGRALEVRSARGELALSEGTLGVEVVPPGAPLGYALALDGGRVRGTLESPGRALFHYGRARPPRLSPQANDYEPLAEVWLRGADGLWEGRGAWPLGASLPDPVAGAGAPPGWLASGAAPERILVARREEDGCWLRVQGFPE